MKVFENIFTHSTKMFENIKKIFLTKLKITSNQQTLSYFIGWVENEKSN